jgi:hypothetical protein
MVSRAALLELPFFDQSLMVRLVGRFSLKLPALHLLCRGRLVFLSAFLI